ncbi:YifB family Mg chelatase-like AAA ATPase [Cellulosimicrobium arenosum]|uniref:YifB family Mg chelatase-like AAA ATPase n=1 Tax=Cellulosimicrobium arenosum TaxID=2708133 RepID=A0A927G9C0_9MICO|nr:YifB family Mg chelatase-like AAA ATPase [Cellulosimicrobium arenosum]MBD8079289.1 YifB family Mg chelatase-like AAA ATPase [Cellulosimicrobium arenosum]
MGLGMTRAVALVGFTGHVVEVQAHLAASVPGFTLVGLPDTALSESRDRVRAAVASTGLTWPQRKITVNLSPAALPKTGTGFDLAIAVATLAGAGVLRAADVAGVVHVGELGLDGRLHPGRGVLPAVAAAVAAGFRDVVVPAADAAEARLVPGARVVGAVDLAQVAQSYGASVERASGVDGAVAPARTGEVRRRDGDLADVLGQDEARHAIEVAAAGGHHLLLVGAPGAGKTMLASRLPGILPDLTEREAVEVTAVHSVAGVFDPGGGLLRRPPYEDPHHTATPASIVGGGSGLPRPGAASRAHRGVLFMDEAPEFGGCVLQTLRQPLEHGELVIHRAAGSARYPARFQLVLAANPCPCGQGVGKGLDCSCTALARRRYLGRLSGPLLDRVDVQVEVRPVTRVERAATTPPESSAVVAARVRAAREAASVRLRSTPWRTNAEVSGAWLRSRLGADHGLLRDVDAALDRGTLSLRGADRVLRLAWTVADLAGRDAPTRGDIGLGLALRTRGQHG